MLSPRTSPCTYPSIHAFHANSPTLQERQDPQLQQLTNDIYEAVTQQLQVGWQGGGGASLLFCLGALHVLFTYISAYP